MIKFYTILIGYLSVVLGASSATGQTLPSHGPRTCATEQAQAWQQAQLQRLRPGYNPARAQATKAAALRTAATTYTLPVIVHVVHNGEPVGTGSNISQAQVQSQLEVLNEDYRNRNADGTLVPNAFQALRGDMQLQFVLASIAPDGSLLAEPGIDRVNRTAKGWNAPPYANTTYIDATIKPGSYWDPDKYINIWVLDLGPSLLGYAQFPDNTARLGGLSALGGSAATDGVVVLYSAFGRRGTLLPDFNKGRTLTHELGHWFGLRHIWGDDQNAADDCAGSDYADDTPNQATANVGCPTFPHVSCANGSSGDMFMNYMDYSDDACLQMFSLSQKDRMQAVMAANTPRRSILATSTAGCPLVVAATVANSGATCQGGTVALTATGPAGATYAWTGPNSFTSTQQNPTLPNVTAAMAGAYTVRVSVTTGACPALLSTAVVVAATPPTPALVATPALGCPGAPATLAATNVVPAALPSEDFNGSAPGWTLANAGTASTGWQYRTAYSYSSNYLNLSNYSLNGSRFVLANSDAGGPNSSTNTTLTSPAFSTVGYSTLRLTFQQRLLYAGDESPLVEISTNGTTWATLATYLSTQGTATAPATTTLDLTAYAGQPSVQVRWRYVGTWEYYWALDNVQFSGTQQVPAYAWSLVSGDGLPAATNTPTLTVAPTQNSVYRLTVGYAGGTCTATSTVAVNRYPAPALTASLAAVCPGSPTVLSATNLGALPAVPTYTWSLVSGDGLPAITTTPTLVATPTQTSVYRLTVDFAGAGCPTTSTVRVAVTQPTWTGAAGNGNWFDAGNWLGCVPTRTTDATIPAGLATPSPTIASGTAEVRHLVQPGSLTMTGGALDLYGDHTGSGSFTATGGVVATRAAVAQQLRPATYSTLLIGGAGTKTIGAATVNTALALEGGLLNTGAATVTLAPTATITESDASYVLGRVQTTHNVGTTPDAFGGLGLTLTPAVAPGATTVVRTTGQAPGAGQGLSRYYDLTAAISRSLQGTTLALGYLDHELNGLAEDQLVFFQSSDNGATWRNQGATLRNASTNTVSRNFVTDLQGRWTLASPTTALPPAAVQYAISALPVPFHAEGLSLQLTTPVAGPVQVTLYNVLGQTIYHHAVASVAVGTSTFLLPNSGQLRPGKYILLVTQGEQAIRVNVVRGE